MSYVSPFQSTGNSIVKIGADKQMTINGKRVFPLIFYTITKDGISIDQCATNLQKMKDYTADMVGYKFQDAVLPYYASAGVGFIPMYGRYPVNHPCLLGYSQEDEMVIGLHATAKQRYDNIKAGDQNHPVFVSAWHDGKWWEDCGDVIWYGLYPYADLTVSSMKWLADMGPREVTQYKYEFIVKNNILLGYNNFDETIRPFYPVIQSLGARDDAYKMPTTLAETKALAYSSICMNVKGMAFWSFSWTPNNAGLWLDQQKVNEHVLMVQEIRLIEDILLLPTKDYSWQYRKGSQVSFSNPLSGTWNGYQNFNYMLKQDGSIWYLIVVNKDSRSCITDIQISGLPGQGQVVELGLNGTGAQPGRVTSHTNGKIAGETFQGLGVKIYKIMSTGSIPPMKYACINGTCQESTQGFDTLALCQQNCTGGTVKYDCVNGNCVQAANGQHGSLEECSGKCLQGQVQGEGTMFAIVGVMAGYLILKQIIR